MLRLAIVAPLVGALLTLLGPISAGAQGFAVVVSPDNPVKSLTRKELADIFYRRTKVWPGGREIRPVDQAVSSAVRDRFSRAVLEKPATAVASYWRQQIFGGRNLPPLERPDDAAVIAFLRDDPRSIGYVSPGAVPPDLRVIQVVQ